jgi:hypothetical protein
MPKLWQRQPEILTLPNIPKPLHGVNPRTVLGGTWWNLERREAYASTNYHCEACGTSKHELKGRKILEGHEVYETDYENGRLHYIKTTPLCPLCHQFIHDGRLSWLLDTRQISFHYYAYILKHGHRVLEEAGLARPSLQERHARLTRLVERGKLAKWSQWRLVVNGVEYPPQKPDPAEFNEHYRD